MDVRDHKTMPLTPQDLAPCIRAEAMKMAAATNNPHIDGALSMAGLLAVLYGGILRVNPADPRWPGRDRFILSKGDCCATLYAALALRGFFPIGELKTFGREQSRLLPDVSHLVPGVEFSTGSHGFGISHACGRALSARRRGESWRAFVMLSTAELGEGSIWEALSFAPKHGLDNLIVTVDYNKNQSLGTVPGAFQFEPLVAKFEAFRWSVREVDGHDLPALQEALGAVPWEKGKPSCLFAHTAEPNGVDFMEKEMLSH